MFNWIGDIFKKIIINVLTFVIIGLLVYWFLVSVLHVF